MSAATAERALLALSYWLRRRDVDAVVDVMTGISEADRAEMRETMEVPGLMRALYDMPVEELRGRMLGLGGKAYGPLVQRRPMSLGEWAGSGLPASGAYALTRVSAAELEHKSLTATDVTVETGSDLGSFSGYLAVFARDSGGDTIAPQALEQTVKDFNEGRRRWLLTDSHSDLATMVVAEVDTARLDEVGLFVTAKWLGSDGAQALRQMVLDGARLGLSIDYTAEARPDGQGGRLLEQVNVYGGAVTPKPMNGLAIIVEGKGARGGTVAPRAPVVDLYADVQARHADPDRDRLARMAEVVSASWVSPALVKSIGTEAAYGLVMDAARSSAARQAPRDPERERWEQDNAYSSDLAEWMARHR